MAFLWMDSFDHMVGADLAAKYNTAGGTISAGAGRRGSAAYYANAGPAYTGGLTRTLAPADNTCILGVAVKLGDVSSSGYYYFLGVLKAGTVQCSVNINASGYLQLYRGDNGGTLLATAATQPLIANTYSYVELKVVVHPSTGSATLRVDGTSVLTVPTANTAAGGSAGWDQVRIGGNSFAIAYPSLDDYYVLDGSGSAPLNDFLGNVRVDAGYPTGAGATTGWTPSAGANYACVDEATPNGDTDYVTASSSPLTDTYNVSDIPLPGAPIYGVQVSVYAKKTDAGSCTLAPVVRHSGTDYVGTGFAPATTYGYNTTPYGTNPGTGAAWTEAGFNAIEVGVKRTA